MKHSQRTANCPSPARKQMFSTAYLYLPAPFHLSLFTAAFEPCLAKVSIAFSSRRSTSKILHGFVYIYTITIITSRLQSLAQLLVFAVSAISLDQRERERDLFTPIFCQRFPPSDHGYVRVTYIRRQKSICANESSRNDVEKR